MKHIRRNNLAIALSTSLLLIHGAAEAQAPDAADRGYTMNIGESIGAADSWF